MKEATKALTTGFQQTETPEPPIIARGIQEIATLRALTNPNYPAEPFKDLRDSEINLDQFVPGELIQF